MYYLTVVWLCTCGCWLEINQEVERRPLQAMKGQKIDERQERLIGTSMSKPHTSKNFVGSFCKYKWQKPNTKPYKFLCDTEVLYSIRNLPYIFLLSLLHYPTVYGCWIVNVTESIDKVFLNSHIWLLDRQCHESMWQSFSEWPLLLWPFDCQ